MITLGYPLIVLNAHPEQQAMKKPSIEGFFIAVVKPHFPQVISCDFKVIIIFCR